MFFLLVYLGGVTVVMSVWPHWPTAMALGVPAVAVAVLRLAVAFWPRRPDPAPRDPSGGKG